MTEFKIDNKRIAKNTMALYFRMGITMLVAFFTTRVVLEVLGSEDYGLNNLVGSIVSMLSFINGSMGTAVQRFYSIEIGKNNEKRLGRVFGTGLYLHLIVAALTVFIAELFAIFFLHKLNIPPERQFAAQVVFQISIVTLAMNIINVPYAALLRAREEFSRLAVVEIVQSLLRLLILYFLCHIQYDKLIVFAILNFLISVYYVMAITLMARKYAESRSAICKDREIIRGMLQFVSMLIVTVLASLFRDKGLVILINLFFGLTINAAYAIAMQVMTIVSTFVMNFKQSVIPQLMAAYGAGDLQAMNRLVLLGTKVTFILMLIITMPLIFEAQTILELWLGTPPAHSAELVQLVLININISSYTYFLYQGVHATGHITKQQSYMSILYIVNILLMYIFFKLGFNFYTAIYITIFISLLQCIVNFYFAKKYFLTNLVKYLLLIIYSIIIVMLLAALLFFFINVIPQSFVRILLTTLISIFVSLIMGLLILFSREEKNKFIKIYKK